MSLLTFIRPVAVAAAVVFAATGAFAENTTTPNQDAASGGGRDLRDTPVSVARVTDEVLVSTTRRGETNILTTAASVTAANSADLDRIGAINLEDVAKLAPNFSAARITGFNAAGFAMRGIGQTDIIIYLDAPVGVTVDDFVMPSVQTQLIDMFDIERVEVLRGPQGTLFGKNTTAGAVVITTKRPDLTDYAVSGRFQVANYGTARARLAVNVPLVKDKLAVRFAGSYNKTSGYYHNGAKYGPVFTVNNDGLDPTNPYYLSEGSGDGARIGGEDAFNGRVKVLFQPTDNFEALLQYEFVRDRGDSPPATNETPSDIDPETMFPLFVWTALGLTRDEGDPLDVAAVTNRNDGGLSIGRGHRINVDGVYLNMNLDLDNFEIISVTGYRKQTSRLGSTYVGEVGPVSHFDANRDDDRKTFQQEVRLVSKFDGKFNFVAGGFYQQNDAKFCVTQVLGFLDLIGLIGAIDGGFNNNPQILCNRQDAEAFALFFDGSFNITDKLTLEGGFRYTWEKKSWMGRHQVFFQQLTGGFDPDFTYASLERNIDAADFSRFPFGVVSDDEKWSDPTWRATLSYQATEELFLYFTVSRGFKSGGYNDQTGTTGNLITAEGAAPYDPEYATSYEFGVKTDLADNRVRLAASFFFVKYSDAQRGIVATLENAQGETFQETRFFNAASIEVKGIEIEGTFIILENLILRGNFSWQDGKYNSFRADTDLDGDIDVDFSGRALNRAPKFTALADLTYFHTVGNAGELMWNANVSYESRNRYIYSDLGDQYDTVLRQKAIANLSVTYTSADQTYRVRAFVNNVFDKRYETAAQPVANLWTFATWGAPRTYGIEVGFDL